MKKADIHKLMRLGIRIVERDRSLKIIRVLREDLTWKVIYRAKWEESLNYKFSRILQDPMTIEIR